MPLPPLKANVSSNEDELRSPLEPWSCWCCGDDEEDKTGKSTVAPAAGTNALMSCPRALWWLRVVKISWGQKKKKESKRRQRFTKFLQRNYTMRVWRGNQKSVQSSQMFSGYARCISLSRQTPRALPCSMQRQDGSLISVSRSRPLDTQVQQQHATIRCGIVLTSLARARQFSLPFQSR